MRKAQVQVISVQQSRQLRNIEEYRTTEGGITRMKLQLDCTLKLSKNNLEQIIQTVSVGYKK